jgi:hypothetical protein
MSFNLTKVIMFNLVALFIAGVFVNVSAADKAVEANKATVHDAVKMNDIRLVDFNNFTYHFKEYKNVRMRDGSAKLKGMCFGVGGLPDRMLHCEGLYGDITGDGHEEAVIVVGSFVCGANFADANVFIYTMKNTKPALLASIDDVSVGKDIKHNYPNLLGQYESFQGVDALSIEEGALVVRGRVGEYHREPHYRATLKYKFHSNKLMLVDKPELVDKTGDQ